MLLEVMGSIIRGYARLFHDHILQADQGCDFDFLLREGPPPV